MEQILRNIGSCARRAAHFCSTALAAWVVIATTTAAVAQQSSISAWDAADFRVWGFVPYWATTSQINNFPSNGMYGHVSDVLYFGAVRPDASGNMPYGSSTYQANLATMRSQAVSSGFKLHLSMMAVTGGSVTDVWNSIIASPANRANFVNQLKTIMVGNVNDPNDDIKGFNFDWERPATQEQWRDYTQLALDLRNAIHPLGMEVTVDDYGSTDTKWDNLAPFNANIYDQLFIMGYHYTASQNNGYANGKNGLTQQGAGTGFKDEQLVLGIGTWGAGGPATVSLENIVGVNPNLPYDALTFTGTVNDINGVSRTGTWNIESRKQVREKTQLALDRNMAGMMSWTLHYDATGQLGLHRVMQHYINVNRNAPDLNLDGKINTADATALANQMGAALTNTGMASAAQFDAFYLSGNWEKGDHDGNGFVNQADADWLASRYAALGVNLPDRLSFSGTFENFQNAQGIAGRWRAGRNAQQGLIETGNFTQHGANYLTFAGSGTGYTKHSTNAVTLRNQNSAESTAGVNAASRTMEADLSTPIDLGQDQTVYFTFLVRQNTGSLLPSQVTSPNRTLALEFLNGAGTNQFDFALLGQQQVVALRSQADSAGQDKFVDGVTHDVTHLFIGKISGNGADANTLQAAWFPTGSAVGNFTAVNFPWMVTVNSSSDFNPVLTKLRFTSAAEANYTVSNVWVGSATSFIPTPSPATGDYNGDGIVDAGDYSVWRDSMGQVGSGLRADGNANGQIDAGDYDVWRAHFGQQSAGGAGANVNFSSSPAAPEPTTLVLLAVMAIIRGVTSRCR